MTTFSERASQAADVVAIYRAEDMSQVMSALRPLSASIFETAELMEHPVEDGSMIADHLVLNPTDVELPCVVQAVDIPAVIDEARELHVGGVLLTVQTRSGSVLNMVLTAIPREETPASLDAPNVLLRLRQARFVEAEYGELKAGQVQEPKNASTTARGQQPARPASAPGTTSNTRGQAQAQATEQRGSTLYRAFKGNRP